MKARPINLKMHEVLSILGGYPPQKLHRMIGQQPTPSQKWVGWEMEGAQLNATWANSEGNMLCNTLRVESPFGMVGDWLWVREAWQHSNFPDGDFSPECAVFYRADYFDDPHGPDGERSPQGKYRHWKPATSMPRLASRITLEITDLRVEQASEGLFGAWFWVVGFKRVDERGDAK